MIAAFVVRASTAVALVLVSCAASAESTGPMLKRETAVTSEIVRIGDLVDDAGVFADIAVFRAPDLGHTGTVDALRVIAILRRHGLENVDAHGISEISVTRLSRSIDTQELKDRIAAALAGTSGLGEAPNLTVALDREPHPLQIEAAAQPIRVIRARFDRSSARFDVTFEFPGSSAGKRARFTGTITETVEIAMLVRPAGRGDVIRATDVVIERRAKTAVTNGALQTSEQILGYAARRSLPAGQPLRASDLMKPELVRQNDLVTVIYEVPGINLTLRGKALESGAEGDVVNVLNMQTKRTMQGTITGPHRVSVAATTTQVLSVDRSGVSSMAAAAPQQSVE